MTQPFAILCACAGLAFLASIVHAVPPADQVQPPRKALHESSIGGVITASTLAGKAGQGYLVYNKWCSGCHARDLQPADGKIDALSPVSHTPLGTALLRQRYQGSVPADLESRTDLTPDGVRYFVRNGLNAMPAFRKTEISDPELDALSAYLSRNNDPPK